MPVQAHGAGFDQPTVAAVVGHEAGNITDDVYSGGPDDGVKRRLVEAVRLPSFHRASIQKPSSQWREVEKMTFIQNTSKSLQIIIEFIDPIPCEWFLKLFTHGHLLGARKHKAIRVYFDNRNFSQNESICRVSMRLTTSK